MKQLTKTFFITFLLISAGFGCSTFSPYKVPVLQGNIIEDKDVEQLAQGSIKGPSSISSGDSSVKKPNSSTEMGLLLFCKGWRDSNSRKKIISNI